MCMPDDVKRLIATVPPEQRIPVALQVARFAIPLLPVEAHSAARACVEAPDEASRAAAIASYRETVDPLWPSAATRFPPSMVLAMLTLELACNGDPLATSSLLREAMIAHWEPLQRLAHVADRRFAGHAETVEHATIGAWCVAVVASAARGFAPTAQTTWTH